MDPSPRQLPLGITLRPGTTLADFFAGPNTLAVDMVAAAARTTGERQLWLAGGSGLGKSHLLQAACHAASGDGCRPAYLPLGGESGLRPEMLDGLEALDLICVDDADTVAGEPEWEQALFALINASRAGGTRLLFAGRRGPAHAGVQMPDLASRLAWGPVLRLTPLDDAQKRAALMARARRLGLELSPAAAAYLSRHYARDLAGQLQRLELLDRASLAAGRRLTVPFIKQVLGDRS